VGAVSRGRPSQRQPSQKQAGKQQASRKQPGQKKARPPMPPGREARPPRAPRPELGLADPATGRGIVTASIGGTAALLVTAVAADVAPGSLEVPALVVALAMFVGGTAAFVWAYLVAIGRSRTDDVSLLGVYGLVDSTPAPVKVRLWGSLVAEIVIALATAGARLYSTLSFGILAVMWGLGLAGLWGARHGAFPPRAPNASRRRRNSP
jgi:hypothetical protein